MAFVPGYEYDVFISYSRANNYDNWVSTLRAKLGPLLDERIPGNATARIFFDTSDLAGNGELTPDIQRAVRNCAVFVPIVSEKYVTKDWCRRECAEFLAANKNRDISRRIFPIRYDEVTYGKFQELIGERIGYEFFGKSENANYFTTLAPDSSEFKNKLMTLRMDISSRLLELQAAPVAAPETSTVPSGQPSIFLANSVPGLAPRVDDLASFLRTYKIDVVQPGHRFYDVDGYGETFAKGLKNSLLFVQLLSRQFDPHPDEAFQSWDRWQAKQAQDAGIPVLQWLWKFDQQGKPIDLALLDASHREFVTRPSIWDFDFDQFKTRVREEVEHRRLEQRQQVRACAEAETQPLVILRADKSDQKCAEDIGRSLTELGCEWLRIPDKNVSSLEDFARDHAAEGLLFVYQACPEQWVLSRLQEVRKFLKSPYGRRWACGLWRSPADPENSLSCSMNGLVVIDSPKAGLEAFVSRLRASEVAAKI